MARTGKPDLTRSSGRSRGETWIVDGHNVIYQVPDLAREQTSGEKRRARAAVIRRVEAFSRRRGIQAVIVFDGEDAGPSAEARPGVDVFFASGPGGADDRIARTAEELVASGKRVTVVTDDRGLKARLPGRAETRGVLDFWKESGPHPGRGKPLPSGDRIEEKPGFYAPDIEAHFLEKEREMREKGKGRRSKTGEDPKPPRR